MKIPLRYPTQKPVVTRPFSITFLCYDNPSMVSKPKSLAALKTWATRFFSHIFYVMKIPPRYQSQKGLSTRLFCLTCLCCDIPLISNKKSLSSSSFHIILCYDVPSMISNWESLANTFFSHNFLCYEDSSTISSLTFLCYDTPSMISNLKLIFQYHFYMLRRYLNYI